jgi:uncharacterized protein YndB with AHSA1/START domain
VQSMTSSTRYAPGPATGARIQKEGEAWALVLERIFKHPPEKVWRALTEPAHLREWAPFDADGNLGEAGAMVKLATVATPKPQISETRIAIADPPKLLEFNWGSQTLRWTLESFGAGTRLVLWHNIERRFISMGAAGWHICFDVLERSLSGNPLGRIVGADAMKFDWSRLNTEYAKQFDRIEAHQNISVRAHHEETE